MNLKPWQITVGALLLILVGPVLLVKVGFLPISFGADYGFREGECSRIKMSEISDLLVCKRPIFENGYGWVQP